MINANEIKVNNWFHHNVSFWSYRNEDGVISNHGKFAEDCFQWNESDWYALGECTLSLEAVEPILLTEEWLLKSGFELFSFAGKVDRAEFSKIIGKEIAIFDIVLRAGDWWHSKIYGYCLGYKPIKYVHELQNLYFALTGSEIIFSNKP